MTTRSIGSATALLAVVILLLSIPPLLRAATPPAVVQIAVVLVAKRNPSTGDYVPIGTAFHIGEGWFRSAGHVVTATLPKRFEGKGLEQWSLFDADEFGNPRRFVGPFEVACVDPRWKGQDDDAVLPHDSALIRQTAGPIPSAALRTSERRPAAGETVSVWGFPEGSVLFESRAAVLEVSREWVVMRNETGHPTVGGHSGSPVLDRTESVIGILAGGVRGIASRQRAVAIGDAEQGCPRPR